MRNLLLIAGSVLTTLFLIEAVMRLSGYSPRTLVVNEFFIDGVNTTWSMPDDELGWVNKPGVSVSVEYGNAPMTFWSGARRASRDEEAMSKYNMSVMVVGGSNAQSYGVRDGDSFPYKLSQYFADTRIENFGNGGFSTAQALLLTERVLSDFYDKNKPSLIILTFADSHINRNVSDQSWIYSISDSQGRYVAPPHFRLNEDELEFYPFKTIEPWPFETSSAALTMLHNIWLQSMAYNTADQGVAVTRRVLGRFSYLAESNGAELLIAILEDRSQASADIFDGLALNVIDCSGYERVNPDIYLLGGNGHPNDKYHTHFADCIGGWMVGQPEFSGLVVGSE